MTRGLRRLLAALLALILLLLGLLLTLTHWLPRLAGIWLPENTRVELHGAPHWQQGRLVFPDVRYLAGDCLLAQVADVGLGRTQQRWQLDAREVALNSNCLQALPHSATRDAPRSLAEWQQMLPGADIHLQQLSILPWQQYAGRFDLTLDKDLQQLRYQGDNLRVAARLQGQQLHIDQLQLSHPLLPQPVELHGNLTLPTFADGLPVAGELSGALNLTQWPQPLALTLNWQQQQGELVVRQQQEPQPLLQLPWQADAQQIRITAGHWRWPFGSQPLSGGVALTLDDWQQGLEQTQIRGRFNLLTAGRGGKGNLVLSVGPGKLSLTDSALPFQLTGESKFADLQLYGSIPGQLHGMLSDPQLSLQPGALLRLRGRLLSTLEVDEARWPLAGVSVASRGINGRLQAILNAHDPSFGRFRLHLDGRASDFWPDSGRWNWRYWGEGVMAPLSAKWDVKGTGSWNDTLISLDTLNTGFDQLAYGMVQVDKPRLTLTAPVRWQRDVAQPAFNGGFALRSGQTRFSYGGWLPPSELRFDAKGRDPGHFLWRGQLTAEDIGPLRVHGRWDGERLRGEAWWPAQSLSVFQPLLSSDLKMRIQTGELRAQMAFSAASGQGFEAGGFWAVKQGSVWMPDSEINGIDFTLPFRLKDHQWQLGRRGPVSLRIAEVKNQFALQNITADLQGHYPWQERQPLTLSNVNLDLLGGHVSMPALRLPQHQPARISLRDIDLSRLVTALKPKQFAMSGKVNGELPLWVNNPHWLIEKGWIANSGPLTFRMDKDMADAIVSNNVAAGAAMDWLRYMEIARSWATLDLDNFGNLILQSEVKGTSQFSNRRQSVNLNYRHQENLFQLWRSLRFGDNLQSWVEQNATLPSNKDPKP
ncbi:MULTISPECIES: YdbH family protein [unclassified Pantoea]|uniref:YdbH family protein n=1 Tax=unclassified Pantoea TaxID=2630326 RepID=UPI0012321C5D|nr:MULTISPECIES: YdbH family protein [unclassified Pantoea]KAA6103518.1 YdbH family protein [Pantoea sp. B_9]KAA6116492.1 YdbH family protein [Pantoea sp. B_10]